MKDIFLTDKHGRIFNNLRISLTDVCNFGCSYCNPDRGLVAKGLLSPTEIQSITRNLMDLGVSKIRLTGGEPTLRRDLKEIIDAVGELKPKSYAITSHGAYIHKYIDDFKRNNLKHINISLDSLNAQTFHSITKTNYFEDVKNNIIALSQEGSFNIKVNCVIMRGVNSHEIDDFVSFSSQYGVEVRFLELMRIGVANSIYKERFFPRQEILNDLKKKYSLQKTVVPHDSTSVVYSLNNGAKIGYIASETEPFCGTCSRLRLNSKGRLQICLFKEDSVSLRDVPKEMYPEILKDFIQTKPYERIEKVDHMMYQIGG